MTSTAAGAPDGLDLRSSISRLGLGAWVFGGTGWGTQDDRDSQAAILHAVESGINWIDTAAVYGNGHAETIVGASVAKLPEAERPLIFTKGGVRVDPNSGSTYRDLRPASLREECDASLRRLGVERIDLYQLHWPTADGVGIEAAWEALAELASEGKARWIGLSNFSPEQLDRCAVLRVPDAVQYSFSLLARDSSVEITPWATARDVAAITYSPLASGLLTGRFSARRLAALEDEDWRRRRPEFQPPAFDRTLALVERLRPLAGRLDASVAELAIAWVLHWPGVTGAIVGARSASQLEGWIDATQLQLDRETLGEIADAVAQTGAGQGPPGAPGGS
jgi:aryl-alcohol dehydrogenase-like predicted oxidoreductase